MTPLNNPRIGVSPQEADAAPHPAEAEVRRLQEELARRDRTAWLTEQRYQGAEARLLLLAEAADALLSSLDAAAVVPALLDLSRRLFAADAYAMWRCRPGSEGWRVEADYGLSAEYPRSVAGTASPMPEEPLLIEDVTALPLLAQRQHDYQTENIRSLLCVPLRLHGEPTGTITFYYHQPHTFEPSDLPVARALASLAASALTTAELFAEQTRMRLAAEASQQGLAFLAEASRVLASSLDYETTLEHVARLAVPHLADWCVVQVVDPDGSVRNVALAHVDPAKMEWARQLQQRYPFDPNRPLGAARALRTGESVLRSRITDELLESAAPDAERLRVLRAIGLSSVMFVPLRARGRVLGVLSFAWAESGRHYSEADLALAEDLASRAAMAMDNARLYREAEQALDERRQAEEGIRYVMEHARCLLWHAYVRAPSGAARSYQWDLRVFDDPAAQRFLPLDLRPGETYAEALHRSRLPEDQVRVGRNARATFESGASHYYQEYRCVRRDGALRWLAEETHLEALGTGCWRAVGVCTDITERKELEEALQERALALAEADRRKDEFLAMLGHELRNPLAAISNAGSVLDQVPHENPRAARLVSVIGRQTRHLARLVDDLLDVSRITQGKVELQMEDLDLRAVARRSVEATRPAARARSHELVVELPPDPLIVRGDPVRLEQVITNLLGNAIKYTDPGGQIRLSVEDERGSSSELLSINPQPPAINPQPSTAVLRVCDTGVGIPAHVLPHVFDLFFQSERSLDRSQGGLGIGLTTVRTLLEMHGGTITAESAGPGRGSEFTVRLPLRSATGGLGVWNEAPGPPARNPALAPRASRTVLVVEDHADAAETLGELLELWGCSYEIAADGPAALEAAARCWPEVVLLDIGLPGMDGYEVARRLREAVGSGQSAVGSGEPGSSGQPAVGSGQRAVDTGEPGTRNPELGTRNSELGPRNSELGTRNSELGTRNPEPGTRNPEPGTRNPEPGTRNAPS